MDGRARVILAGRRAVGLGGPMRRGAEAGLLLVGIAAGAALGFTAHRWMPRHRRAGDPARIVERLAGPLGLDASQRSAALSVVTAEHEHVVKLHAETLARFEAIRRDSRAALRKLLTPDQGVKFDALTARWDARKKHREARNP
jgi:hypothetical protein